MAVAHRLVIMRHADAATDVGSDESRPLTAAGRRDAVRAGGWLAAHELLPGLVLASSAARARETWALAAPALPSTVEFLDDLYSGGVDAILAALRAVPEACRCVLVLGHNPAMTSLAMTMQAHAPAEPLRVPAAGVVVIAIDAPWSEIDRARGDLELVFSPEG